MGGHIIIRNDMRDALIAPLVWAALPSFSQTALQPVFYNADGSLRDTSTWDQHECWLVGSTSHWAVCNL